jgi:signal peptidase I
MRKKLAGKTEGKSIVKEYVEAIVIAVLLALFIRTFVVQAFKIPSGSMLPTLQIGDHLLVNKFIYGLRMPFTGKLLIPWKSPVRGDVVVFRFPKDRDIDYIKRVVAVAGDKVEIVNKRLIINDAEVVDLQAYFEESGEVIDSSVSPRDNFGPVAVPAGKIFVMGDNRDNSYDSRFWGFVDYSDILGKAFILYWSWDIGIPLRSFDRLLSIRWSRIGDVIQ